MKCWHTYSVAKMAHAQSVEVVPLILQVIAACLFVLTCMRRWSPSTLGVSPAKNASSAGGGSVGVGDCAGVADVGVGAKGEG